MIFNKAANEATR